MTQRTTSGSVACAHSSTTTERKFTRRLLWPPASVLLNEGILVQAACGVKKKNSKRASNHWIFCSKTCLKEICVLFSFAPKNPENQELTQHASSLCFAFSLLLWVLLNFFERTMRHSRSTCGNPWLQVIQSSCLRCSRGVISYKLMVHGEIHGD